MKQINTIKRPIKAEDYGKAIAQTPKSDENDEVENTDGRKVFALWYR